MLTLEDTVKTYSGKPGCMCGCRGTYNDGERARKMAVSQMLKDNFRVQEFGFGVDESAGCVYVETETRNRVLYVTAAGLQKLKEKYPDHID